MQLQPPKLGGWGWWLSWNLRPPTILEWYHLIILLKKAEIRPKRHDKLCVLLTNFWKLILTFWSYEPLHRYESCPVAYIIVQQSPHWPPTMTPVAFGVSFESPPQNDWLATKLLIIWLPPVSSACSLYTVVRANIANENLGGKEGLGGQSTTKCFEMGSTMAELIWKHLYINFSRMSNSLKQTHIAATNLFHLEFFHLMHFDSHFDDNHLNV